MVIDLAPMDTISSVGPIPAVGALNPQGPRNPAQPSAAAPASAPPGKGSAPAARALITAAVEAANQALDQSKQGFSFEFDDTLDGMSVKIIDKRTNAVVRLVPSLEMMRLAHPLTDTPARGALLKSEA